MQLCRKTSDSSVQFFGALVNARRCAVPVEVPLLQVIDSHRHPCCGGPDSNCGGAAEAVGETAKTVDVHRLRFL